LAVSVSAKQPKQESSMTDQTQAPVQEAAPVDEPKIMCYVSKKMVPKSKTVEVEYSSGKKVWVLAKYIKYDAE